MEQTPLGLKKPTTGDANDLYQFVGDNMDLLEQLIQERKKTTISSTAPTSPKNNDIWIDTSS